MAFMACVGAALILGSLILLGFGMYGIPKAGDDWMGFGAVTVVWLAAVAGAVHVWRDSHRAEP